MLLRHALVLTLVACGGKDLPLLPDTGAAAAAGPNGPTAPLAALSDGECPDMSGTSRFSSGGLKRRVRIVTPKDAPPGLPVVFGFHGLVPTGFDAIGDIVDGFDLKSLADELGVVFVVPEARELEFPGFGSLLLWGILDDTEPDLVLYDDLRTCLSRDLDVDLERMSVWGFSGGALWTSVIALERADTLASFVEFSGGNSFTVPLLGGPYIPYATPPHLPPALLVSGGDNDVWPDTTFTVIDFEDASDSLARSLANDGAVVARCHHQLGHTIPSNLWDLGVEWLVSHSFTGDSPWADGAALADDCELL